jgi:hypothetical protein
MRGGGETAYPRVGEHEAYGNGLRGHPGGSSDDTAAARGRTERGGQQRRPRPEPQRGRARRNASGAYGPTRHRRDLAQRPPLHLHQAHARWHGSNGLRPTSNAPGEHSKLGLNRVWRPVKVGACLATNTGHFCLTARTCASSHHARQCRDRSTCRWSATCWTGPRRRRCCGRRRVARRGCCARTRPPPRRTTLTTSPSPPPAHPPEPRLRLRTPRTCAQTCSRCVARGHPTQRSCSEFFPFGTALAPPAEHSRLGWGFVERRTSPGPAGHSAR